MTDATQAPKRGRKRPDVTPKAGPTFRAVAALSIEHPNARKLLALIAAYADAGEPSPRAKVLQRRAGFDYMAQVDGNLRRLEEAGLLEIQWGDQKKKQRNRYRVILPETTRRAA